MSEQNKSKVEIGEESKYEVESDYLPVVLEHNRQIELIRASKSLIDSVIVISPVILLIFLASILVSNNLKLQGNYEKNTPTERAR